jgi:outer membrane protein OmpA-like peptidoglycan-associated protein
MIRAAIAIALTVAFPAFGEIALSFNGDADETFSEQEQFASYQMPVGSALVRPIRRVVAEGAFSQKVWQVPIAGSTTLRVMDDLRVQLETSGFEVLFECETRTCGGFDFRFATRIAPEPAMHVDLGDFRYVALQRLGQVTPEYLSLIVSRSGDVGYVQMIFVGPSDAQATDQVIDVKVSSAFVGSVKDNLDRFGVSVLSDLVFSRGSSQLDNGEFTSLRQLADYLAAHPDRQIVLVGHTDAEGSLDGNIALSRKRAESVVDRLVGELGVSNEQVSANGVGFLAPKASNLTEEGRTKNRRVEAVLASTR